MKKEIIIKYLIYYQRDQIKIILLNIKVIKQFLYKIIYKLN